MLDLAQPGRRGVPRWSGSTPWSTEYGLDYLKWDHNRDLHAAQHRPDGRRVPGVHAQTLAVYAAAGRAARGATPASRSSPAPAAVRASTSASSARTDRVWASDCNDAVERAADPALDRQPAAAGAGGRARRPAAVAHHAPRTLDLPFRLATALFGHAGIEWDLTSCTPEELAGVRAWAALYRGCARCCTRAQWCAPTRPTRAPCCTASSRADRAEAVYCFARLATSPGRAARPAAPARARPGPAYQLTWLARGEHESRCELGRPRRPAALALRWAGRGLAARVLAGSGLTLPVLDPGQALVLHLTAAG